MESRSSARLSSNVVFDATVHRCEGRDPLEQIIDELRRAWGDPAKTNGHLAADQCAIGRKPRQRGSSSAVQKVNRRAKTLE
jgi:hypothetical protein